MVKEEEIWEVSLYDPEAGGYVVEKVRTSLGRHDAIRLAKILATRIRNIDLELQHATRITYEGKDVIDAALDAWSKHDYDLYLNYWEPNKYGEDMLNELKEDDPSRWRLYMGTGREYLKKYGYGSGG